MSRDGRKHSKYTDESKYAKYSLDPTMPRIGRPIGFVPSDFMSAVLSIEGLIERLMSGRSIESPILTPQSPSDLLNPITMMRLPSISRESTIRYHPAFDMSILVETRAPRLLTMAEFAKISGRRRTKLWTNTVKYGRYPFIATPSWWSQSGKYYHTYAQRKSGEQVPIKRRNYRYWFALETAELIASYRPGTKILYDVTDVKGVVGRLIAAADGTVSLAPPTP
jgi:hypothetical protein